MGKIAHFNNGMFLKQKELLETDLSKDLINSFVLESEQIQLIFTDPVYQEVIQSKAFQRLRQIHFLGSIDYTPIAGRPEKKTIHTRFQHSLGVASLALEYSLSHNLSIDDQRLCVVAALLHDIGHAPLSHSFESVFNEVYGINHHISGEAIIRGEESVGKDLAIVLDKWGINPFELLAIISGHGNSPQRELFSYQINIDTIEAITRSQTYLNENISIGKLDILNAFLPVENNQYGNVRNTEILDSFWKLKGFIYEKLIQSKWGIVADLLCQQYMRKNIRQFKKSYYYGTEKILLTDHKKLFDDLRNIDHADLTEFIPDKFEIDYSIRYFDIRKNSKLTSTHSLKDRYIQKKVRSLKIFNQVNYGQKAIANISDSLDLF